MAMDLYLSNCYNTAQAAAAKAAASSLTADREQCNSVSGDQLVLLRDPGLVSEGKEGGQTEEGEISAEGVIKDEYRAPWRKDILRRLKKGRYVTSNNKVVCTLKELNKYRQYLTSLKLHFEINYIREQEWKTKEMLLLTKIGEEVKREARVEEQRRKDKEEAHQKKWPKLTRIAIDGESESGLNLDFKGWSEMGPVSRK
ncbi:hypothetical protein J1605_001754 [Eschrichtius robustus]|uniref:Uncharacterized protein n=1 Tax=Eschrichtius robustus TaxID=9764 RepID=A0AB34HXA4_ESCRO|nr:hypothetical protein J1605_001754 [Eschrichtius robustus]